MCLIDLTVTLTGQPEPYWNGQYSHAKEGNPIPRWLLNQHPLALISVILIWIALFSSAILLLSKPAARVVAFAVMLGHTCAAAGWLLQTPLGIILCVGLVVAAKLCDKLIWRESLTGCEQQ
jgi:uncharacterized membrane protein YciS (DUF1049 family)